MSKLKLTNRDTAVASATEASGLVELYAILREEKGVSTVMITRFGCDVIYTALEAYLGRLLELLEEDDFETESV